MQPQPPVLFPHRFRLLLGSGSGCRGEAWLIGQDSSVSRNCGSHGSQLHNTYNFDTCLKASSFKWHYMLCSSPFSVHRPKACSSDKRNTNEEYEVVHHPTFHYHTHSTSKEKDNIMHFVSVKRKTVAGILQANLEIKMHHLRPAYEKRAITAFSMSTGHFVLSLRAGSGGDWRRWVDKGRQ